MKDEISDVRILIEIINSFILFGGLEFIDLNDSNLRDTFPIACKLVSFKHEAN